MVVCRFTGQDNTQNHASNTSKLAEQKLSALKLQHDLVIHIVIENLILNKN